jgi:hypothetical protein
MLLTPVSNHSNLRASLLVFNDREQPRSQSLILLIFGSHVRSKTRLHRAGLTHLEPVSMFFCSATGAGASLLPPLVAIAMAAVEMIVPRALSSNHQKIKFSVAPASGGKRSLVCLLTGTRSAESESRELALVPCVQERGRTYLNSPSSDNVRHFD